MFLYRNKSISDLFQVFYIETKMFRDIPDDIKSKQKRSDLVQVFLNRNKNVEL